MSACESMVGLILASVEGTLDAASRALLEAHAAACPGCRRALDEQSAVKRMLADLPEVAVSRGFAARVRERVEPRPWWMPAGNWRLWTLRLAPLAAVLTIVAWLPLQEAGVTGGVASVPSTVSGDIGTGAGGVGGTTTGPAGAMESWATAAVVAGASAAGETAVVPQLLDPSVHAHTLLAPSAAAAAASSSSSSSIGGSSR